MAFMLRAASVAFFLILPLTPAVAQPASAPGFHSRARLISGGQQGDVWLAGIEITLDQGFKTYWRNPGDSGLPPRFDWSGSDNLAATEVRYPAPTRHEDAAGVAYVYDKRVVLPVLVTAKDKTRPVKLVLSAEYGVCKDICIPARAEMSLTLPGDGSDRTSIEAALARVPRPQPLGAQADLSVLSIRAAAGDKPAYLVTVRAPEGAKPSLFAEGPDDWYLSTTTPDADNRFTLTVEDRPRNPSGAVPVRLTLVAGDASVETEVSLDGNGHPR